MCSLFTNLLPIQYCFNFSKCQLPSVETQKFLWQKLAVVDRHMKRREHIVCIWREQLCWESVRLQTAPNPITIPCRYKIHISYIASNQSMTDANRAFSSTKDFPLWWICMDTGHVTKQHGSYSHVVMGSGRLWDERVLLGCNFNWKEIQKVKKYMSSE